MAYTRRAILRTAVGGFSAFCFQNQLMAATQCVTGPLPGFLPNRLTVDCGSKLNFKLFRKNSDYLGLAGAVSMSFVRAKVGSFPAGSLFLFPWIKLKGQGTNLSALIPSNASQPAVAKPIPDATLPVDEYLCNYVLQAPRTSFIGFQLDVPFGVADAGRDWFSNVPQLADGVGAGIDWTSANLNNPWFGGSHWIPGTHDCYGKAWRQVIVDGLNHAASDVC
jgi:hypothetical protein